MGQGKGSRTQIDRATLAKATVGSAVRGTNLVLRAWGNGCPQEDGWTGRGEAPPRPRQPPASPGEPTTQPALSLSKEPALSPSKGGGRRARVANAVRERIVRVATATAAPGRRIRKQAGGSGHEPGLAGMVQPAAHKKTGGPLGARRRLTLGSSAPQLAHTRTAADG